MWGFILAVIGGLLVPQAEEPLARPLARAVAPALKVEPGEMRLFAFVIVMLIVGILSALLDSGSAFWVILGGALGLFGARLYTFVKAQIDNRGR